MKVAALSDQGLVRSNNEDSYLVDLNHGLLVVCDGMGGHNGGEVASAIAVETINQMFVESSEELPGRLVLALEKANSVILSSAQQDPALHGMGTTATLAAFEDGLMHVAHIGDSSLYMVQDGKLRKITRDHTLAQQLLMEGRLKPEDMRSNPYNHILTRALGVEENVNIDRYQEKVHPGDLILLCSDGLSDKVSEGEMQEVLHETSSSLEQAAQGLLERALKYGGSDNITIILSRIEVGG
ncbi:MAG: Stp1/IreP family PP2C-type Ser/Thr phosphatase [Syntrophomonas sp.]